MVQGLLDKIISEPHIRFTSNSSFEVKNYYDLENTPLGFVQAVTVVPMDRQKIVWGRGITIIEEVRETLV